MSAKLYKEIFISFIEPLQGPGVVHSVRCLVGQGGHEERNEDRPGRGPVVHGQTQRRVRSRGQTHSEDGRKNGRTI